MSAPGGWAAAPNEVLRDPGLQATAKAVFAVLASYSDDRGQAWPAVKTLAANLGMSTDTVDRHLTTLRDYGLIRWDVRATPTGRRRFYTVWRPGQTVPGVTAADGGVTAGEGQGVTAPQGQEQEPGNQEPQEERPAAAADGGLFPSAAPAQVQPMPTGRDLFAAWVDAYSTAHGARPDPSINGQLSGRVREVVKTRTDLESWRHAWRAFKAAGAEGSLYLAKFMLDPAVGRPGHGRPAIPSPAEKYDPEHEARLRPPPRADLYG